MNWREAPEIDKAREALWWAMRDWVKSDKPAYSTLQQFDAYRDAVARAVLVAMECDSHPGTCAGQGVELCHRCVMLTELGAQE